MTSRMLHKMAEELQQQLEAPEHPAKTLAKGVLGMGVGMGGGYLGAKGADYLLAKTRGYGLQKPELYFKAIPIAAGVAGMATPFLMQAMLGKMRQNHLARQEQKKHAEDR